MLAIIMVWYAMNNIILMPSHLLCQQWNVIQRYLCEIRQLFAGMKCSLLRVSSKLMSFTSINNTVTVVPHHCPLWTFDPSSPFGRSFDTY